MKEALNLALEYVERNCPALVFKAIKEALAQPVQEPVAILLQLRSALALASAICDAVPSRESGHLGALVNAQPDGSHGYHQIQDAEAALVKYLAAPAAPPSAQPEQEPVATLNISHFKGHLENHDFDYFGDLPNGTHALYTTPPKPEWAGLMRGVRVGDNTVVISVDSNEVARALCHELILEMAA